MNPLKYVLSCLVIIACIFSCAIEPVDAHEDNALDPLNYYQELDISYGSDINQKFDLYLPANRKTTTKTIILVHGGGWAAGDKIDMNPIKDLIRQDLPDLAIVNINYRLADANNKPYPMQIDDITLVINYLKENKSKYTISDDFGFIGTSAGGHLSLLWSYGYDTNKHVNMVCSIVGPTNLTDPAYLNNTNPELQILLAYFGINSEISYLEKVSPLHRVTATAPPTILFYGAQDPLVPTTQGIDLDQKLTNLGVPHEFTLYPNAGHGWGGLEFLDTWTKLKSYIIKNL